MGWFMNTVAEQRKNNGTVSTLDTCLLCVRGPVLLPVTSAARAKHVDEGPVLGLEEGNI